MKSFQRSDHFIPGSLESVDGLQALTEIIWEHGYRRAEVRIGLPFPRVGQVKAVQANDRISWAK